MRYKNDVEQVYAAIGGDYKGVMERLPSADFVRRFALKFLQDDSFPNLKKALEEKDAPTAFRAAHTLKGVCQNLGFDALYVLSSALTEALRGGSLDSADELFPPVEKEYQRVVEALKGWIKPTLSLSFGSNGDDRRQWRKQEELLGPRPAGCERQRSRRWEPQPGQCHRR